MLRFRISSWQRGLGGLAGVLLLAFALLFHFFPNVLNVKPSSASASTSAFPHILPGRTTRQSTRLHASEASAGPPIALAPRAVLDRRTRERIDAAMQAIAVASTVPETPTSPEIAQLLQRAHQSLEAGNLVGNEHSAARLYAQALNAKRDSRAAARGLAEVHVELVNQIRRHLHEGDLDAAANSMQVLARLPGTDVDMHRLKRELAKQRQVLPILARASNLMQEGKLFKPADANALALYHKVLTLDPDNTVATQGLARIQREVLDQALGAVAGGDFDAAEAELAQAAKVIPGSLALRNTRQRIADIRTQHAASMLAQARTALDSGNLDLAASLKKQALDLSSDVPGVDAFEQQMKNARLYASYQPGQVFSDPFLDISGQAPHMVVIPTGEFLMGSSGDEPDHQANESPQHKVKIVRGFAIARGEVTVGQFRRFVQASGYVPDSVKLGGSSVYDGRSGVMRNEHDATWEDDYAGNPANANLPVVNVSWNDAHAYVQWLSNHTGKLYQLPSEAQFAYALRAGSKQRYWWGQGVPTNKVENITGSNDRSPKGRRWTHSFKGYRDGYWGPAPSTSFAPNPFGLYDMDGNVTEWVRDCWHANYTRAPNDGSAWINPGCSTRVLRGGSWGSGPEQVRSAWRRGALADTRSGRVGFRVARQL